MKIHMYSILLTLFVMVQFFPTAAFAQKKPVDPPAAPVPPQIASALSVFISNATGQGFSPKGVADLTYNEFYADMKAWGKYELVPRPADADLVIEIRYMQSASDAGMNELFSAVIRDYRTRTILWSVSEIIPQGGSDSSARKKFDQALLTLVDDLKKLTAANTASAAQPHH